MTRVEVEPPGHPAGPPAGEWLFKKGGQVFGPVSGGALVGMLARGEVDAATPISADGGAFRPMGQHPAFLVHVKKAEAQRRVEAEITGARTLRRRRRVAKATFAAVAALGAAGLGGYGAFWLATEKPWQRRSALLEDFGGGIAIATPARVGGGRRASAPEEVEIPPETGGPRRARAAQPVSGTAAEGPMVAAQYDIAHIQTVVAREQRTLAPCLRTAAQRAPDFAGEVPLEFAIGNDGRVAQLWIDEPRFRRGELHDCLLRTLRAWSFKPFPGTRPTVSLAFRIGPR